jgi:membrane-associated phospholipid phosphatase
VSSLLLIALLVSNWDVDFSNAARRDTAIVPLRYAMQGTTLLGNYTADATISLGVFVLGSGREARNAKLATVSWIGCGAVTALLKGIVDRERPNHQQSSRWDSSFPSGHTSTYCALATVYGAKYPKLIIPLAVLGAGVAYSRVYLGDHYPTDVLAGAALGVGIGWLTLKLEPELREIPFLR